MQQKRLTSVQAFLKKHHRIALDTSVFIHHLEESPRHAGTAAEIFRWLELAPHSAVTSTLTMTELLVQPYRAGNQSLVNRYYALLSTFPNLEWLAPDLILADMAAHLRAQYRLRTPDALQIATAVRGGATAILTNDAEFRRITQLEVGLLDDFER